MGVKLGRLRSGRNVAEDFRDEGTEEDIWAWEGRGKKAVKKTA